MTETIKTLLQPIQRRLEPALFHAPYIVDGRRVVQANNHPKLGPYMLSDNSMPVIAEFIANAPTDQARLLAAVQAVVAMHGQDTYGPAFCKCGERWPCSTTETIESALSEAR